MNGMIGSLKRTAHTGAGNRTVDRVNPGRDNHIRLLPVSFIYLQVISLIRVVEK
jgi:hypothetical protein